MQRLKKGRRLRILDMHHLSRDELQHRYPNIFKGTLELGIDISKDLIPVVPAAHYFCGGVLTDLHANLGSEFICD